MKIETKYNVGDEVWVVKKYDTLKGWQTRTFPVKGIMIEIDCESIGIEYFTGSPWFESYPEERLFPTQAEAEKECKRRNGE